MAFEAGVSVSCVEGLLFETQVYKEATTIKQDILFNYLFAIPPGVYVTVATSNSWGDSTGLRALLDRTVNSASIITQNAQCTVIVLGDVASSWNSSCTCSSPGEAAM